MKIHNFKVHMCVLVPVCC